MNILRETKFKFIFINAISIYLLSNVIEAAPATMTRDEIICLARAGVGFSYWWGHGAWCRNDCSPNFSCSAGSCSGSCPSCTHTGSYGADCSGFVAKVWQVPNPISVSSDAHPYSTQDFRCSSVHWSQIDKNDIERGDALVYREGGCPGSSGHVMIYESGDPWGNSWTYEARGCSYGIVHNNRSVSSSYVAIRRDNLAPSCTPATEVCDGVDNDCDGHVDEDYTPHTCGVGICQRESTCSGGTESCIPGNPEAETCDGLDNNCNGEVDDGYVPFVCGLGICQRQSVCEGGKESCSPGIAETEICDGLDNDCDGEIDEDNVCVQPVEENLPEEVVIQDESSNEPTESDTIVSDIQNNTSEGIATELKGGCACSFII